MNINRMFILSTITKPYLKGENNKKQKQKPERMEVGMSIKDKRTPAR